MPNIYLAAVEAGAELLDEKFAHPGPCPGCFWRELMRAALVLGFDPLRVLFADYVSASESLGISFEDFPRFGLEICGWDFSLPFEGG